MIRPYPFSAGSVFLQPSTINVNPTLAGPLTRETIDAVFRSVNIRGIDDIYNLCEQRRMGQLPESAILPNDDEEDANITWLLSLTQEGLIEVQNTIAGIRNNIPSILRALVCGDNWGYEVCLYASEPHQRNSYQIVAKAGSIYQINYQGQRSVLMNFSQFLTKAKPFWQPSWNLAGLGLGGFDLSGINLDHVNLEGANLENANLFNSNLCKASLRKANLKHANLGHSDLCNANLTGANLEHADLNCASIYGANLYDSNLCNASLIGANLEHADLDSAFIYGANFSSANLKRANLKHINFFMTIKPPLSLNDRRANFSSANLEGAYFEGAILCGANMIGANLKKANLSSANFSEANFNSANLEGASLCMTTLYKASMLDANLKNAQLWLARSSEANFSLSNLVDAILGSICLEKIEDKLVLEPKLMNASLRPTIFKALFDLRECAKVKSVVRLLQNKVKNGPNWFPDGENRNIRLLSILNNEELQIIVNIAEALEEKINDILEVFDRDADRLKEIVVYPSAPSKTDEFQIIAKEAFIYIRNRDETGPGLQLMSAGQLFCTGCVWNLSGLDLSNLDLSGANLYKGDLSGANLSGTNLTNAMMGKADLSSAILKRANLSGTDLAGANLSEANLSNATGEGTNFTKTNFYGTNLTGVIMHNVDLLQAKFDHAAKLKDISVTFRVYDSNVKNDGIHDNDDEDIAVHDSDDENCSSDMVYEWDEMLNHLANPESGSLLTVIDSIGNQERNKQGKVVKLDMMHQLIKHIKYAIKNKNFYMENFDKPLMDIFTANPIYFNDPLIRAFIKEAIVPVRIKRANQATLKFYGDPELHLLLDVVKLHEQQAQFMLDCNNFFLQLMLQSTEKECAPETQQLAQQLYVQYLGLPYLKGVSELIENVTGGDIRLIDGLEEHMTTGDELPAGACFAFVKNVEDTNHVLILDRIQFHAMQRLDSSDGECRYEALCYAKRSAQQELVLVLPAEQSLPDIVSVFSLFENAYQFKINNATFPQLFTIINLNYDNKNQDPDYLSKDYTSLFLQALSSPQCTTKLCDAQDQLTLTAIFNPLLVEYPLGINTYLAPVNITGTHYADLINLYRLSTSTAITKAQTLFCLAAVFAKYSSSYLFGNEIESPQALRAYAVALLVKAYELDSSIFGGDQKTAEKNFTGWVQKMLGGKDPDGRAVFTCSAVTSGEMLRHAQQQKSFNAIAVKMKPPGW
ncbi:MAG: sopA 4 [Solimicrobium sp.]|jgi:uncharacterized protein YjbI with pentapeptide repeats|nr:sopA 4 [Solimicrobium sp.]